jgi:energy-coupling factor transport system permease protein
MPRPARELHPGAWWIWALGLAVFASVLTNPFLLLLIIGVAAYVVSVRRSGHPWGASFGLYLGLAALIVVIRVGFRILLGSYVTPNDTVLFTLPAIPLPHWVMGIKLLGPVTAASILGGLYDGLRLAAIVVCVGAANALANPKRLLKSLPPAFYEIGTTLVISISVMPQLAESVSRVRRARELRGVTGGRIARMRGVLVPVLEDALERSMSLAAGMDARGYGRRGTASRGQRRLTGALLLGALVGVGVGSYGVLDRTSPQWMSTPAIVLGVVLAIAGFWSAGRRVQRSRYRPDTWRRAEIGVAATGVLVAAGALFFVTDPLVRDPDVYQTPQVPLVAFAIVLLGLAPAWIAPLPEERTRRPAAVAAESGGEAHVRAA